MTRTMAMTTVMAWSFWTRALNMSPTEAVCISTVEVSLIFMQVTAIKAINRTATMMARYLKPFTSTSEEAAEAVSRPMEPRA